MPIKNHARSTTLEEPHDCRAGGKVLAIRVNGLLTLHIFRDIIELMMTPLRVLLVLPKIERPEDLYAVDAW